MASRRLTLVWTLMALLVACAAPAPTGGNRGREGATQASAQPQRTLVIIARGELPSLAVKPFVAYSGSLNPPLRLFNATLDYTDEKEVSQPYLQEALPRLNTDTWRVYPDGRMETTHRLRPDLTWHDGKPLLADDFVFAWRVYATPELGRSGTRPIRQIEEVTAPDPRTIFIRWRQPFPDADRMDVDFQALPRHILEASFEQGDPSSFVNQSYWTLDYVGLGPYKVDRWEPGAYIDASAFDGHALGKPKIAKLRLNFVPDPNTAMANMLSGDAHFVSEFVLGYDEGVTLEREWSGRDGGTIFYAPVLIRISQIQHRPEYVLPKALQDVRVRRALARAFDTPGALDVFTGGRGVITSTLTSPRAEYYPAIERVVTKHDYDPRETQRMLEEVGMTRGSDGFYMGPGNEPFKLDLWSTVGNVFERENRIFVDSLRQAGVDTSPQTLSAAMLSDPEYRAHIPGMFTGGAGADRLSEYSRDAIPRPDNRWGGNNRGGWDNAEFERLWQLYNTTLDRPERIQQISGMEKVFNDEVGAIPHYFTVVVTGYTSQLKGPTARMTPDAPASIFHIEQWEWRS